MQKAEGGEKKQRLFLHAERAVLDAIETNGGRYVPPAWLRDACLDRCFFRRHLEFKKKREEEKHVPPPPS